MATNDEGNNPNPGGSQGGEKLFTQADLDRIVQKRLKEDRDARSKEGLSDAERQGLLNKIEALQTEGTDLRQKLATEQGAHKDTKKAADGFRRAFQAERTNRAIGDAAVKAGAIDPATVASLLKERTRVRELTEDASPTGEYVVEIQVNRTVDGKTASQWVSPDEGVKDLLTASPFLAKSQTPAGAGTQSAAAPAATKPAELPKGVTKSAEAGVGHIPSGVTPGGGGADPFVSAGERLEQALSKA